MRRSLIVLLASSLLVSTATAFAGSFETIELDNQKTSHQAALISFESHTIYREVDVPYTCYHREFVGYETFCELVPRTSCGNENVCTDQKQEVCHTDSAGVKTCETINRRHCEVKNVCRTVNERVCHREPIYRDVADTCYRRETVAVGQETDYRVHAKVTVNVNQVAGIGAVKDVIGADLDGTKLTLSEASTKSGLLYVVTAREYDVNTVKEKTHGSPGHKEVEVTYTLEAVKAADILSPVKGGIQDVKLERDVLRYTIGKVVREDLLATEVEIKRVRSSIIPDKKLIETTVSKADMMLRDAGDRTEVLIDLGALGLKEQLEVDKKYSIRVKVSASDGGKRLLNPGVLGSDTEIEVKTEQKL
jgi:hypothetical protein